MERQPGREPLVTITHVVYALQALSFLTGVTALIAVIISYVKRSEARGTWLESHFKWQIRTFWWGLFWTVVGVILTYIFIGFAVLVINSIWIMYRIIKGWLALVDRKVVG